MKSCICCHKILPLSEFHCHPKMKDGYLNKCKICVRDYVKSWRQKNIDYVQAYDRSRPYRKSATRNKEKDRQQKLTWRLRNLEKRNAHIIVGNAIRDKKLFPQPCERCGCIETNAHHEDYSKPLEVMWLCDKHHGERHKEINEIKRQLLKQGSATDNRMSRKDGENGS